MLQGSYKVIKPLVDLDKLDLLIDICLTGLIDRSEDTKLPDFVRLVELRHRIEPLPNEKSNDLDQIDKSRAEQLPCGDSLPDSAGDSAE